MIEFENDPESVARRMARKTHVLQKQVISKDEYFSSALTRFVGSEPVCWEQALNEVPLNVVNDFYAYCRKQLEPVDFMPFPHGFLVNSRMSQDGIEAIKRELRPRYIQLLEFLNRKINEHSES